ncbi:MAG: PQQ-dependent sugar dehydrogenase [Flavisolibacter sp.]
MLTAPIRILNRWVIAITLLISMPYLTEAQSFNDSALTTFAENPKFPTFANNSAIPSIFTNYPSEFTAENTASTNSNNEDSTMRLESVSIPLAAPGNDLCGGATLITSGATCTTTTGTMVAATVTTTGSCSGTVKADVWYKFVAASTSPTILLKNLGANFTNPGLELYAVCGGASIFCGTVVTVGATTTGSLVASGLTIGSTYFIRIYTTAGSVPASNANFDVCVTDPAPTVTSRTNEVFLQTTLSGSNLLNDPWEVTYGPDDSLWITESKGYKVYKIDPVSGTKITILNLSNGATGGGLTNAEHTTFNAGFANVNNQVVACNCWPQGGLAGLAIHPDFATDPTKRFVYISYIHHWVSGTSASTTGVFFINYLVRFTYDPTTQQLKSPVAICDTLPGSSDHNSQRLIVAKAKGLSSYNSYYYLYYAQGDMGAGQFGNANRAEKAQIVASYEGKILRFNLEPDGDAGSYDKWIPNDNPWNSPAPPATPTTQSAVWGTGIRNNQGFGIANINGADLLYGSSHGPYSDDELNIIDSAKNYGHPLVIGYNDGNYNSYSAGYSGSSQPTIVSESANATSIGASYRDPIFAAYNPSNATVGTIWNTNANANWPSEAWSGMEAYTNSVIPGWKNSLVLGGLKWGRVIRLKLSADGRSIIPTPYSSAATRPVDDTVIYFESTNRFRDIAFAPNGRDMYIIMDRSATTSGPSAANPKVPGCAGCLQKFTFLGYNTANSRSAIPTYTNISIPSVFNSCITTSTATINSGSSNNSLWVPFTGPDGNIVAEVNANGNNLNGVTASFYEKSGGLRQDVKGVLYSNRSFTITPANQPGTAVTVRLYISKGDLDSLKGKTNSWGVATGINTIADLAVYKNSDACGAGSISQGGVWIVPTIAEAFDTGYVLQFSVSSFSSFFLAGKSMIVLPLQLLSFEGSMQKSAASLLWKTTNERNTDFFDVERSTDGRNFNYIGKVGALGNTNNENDYSYVDYDACNQVTSTVYYRLKMVDKNGTYTYSKVIQLECEPTGLSLDVYPNPVHQELNVKVSLVNADNVLIQVTDMQGRIVYSQNKYVPAGTYGLTLDTQGWPAQVYSIKVTTTHSKALIIKNIVKQ